MLIRYPPTHTLRPGMIRDSHARYGDKLLISGWIHSTHLPITKYWNTWLPMITTIITTNSCGNQVDQRWTWNCQRNSLSKLKIIMILVNLYQTMLEFVSIFITHDVMFPCFHYGIRMYTMWLTWLSLSFILNAGYKVFYSVLTKISGLPWNPEITKYLEFTVWENLGMYNTKMNHHMDHYGFDVVGVKSML